MQNGLSITDAELKRFMAAIKQAGEAKQAAIMDEMQATAIEIVSTQKTLMNSVPGAGGKIGRIVTGRLINSFHFEKAGDNYGYSDNLGQRFDGRFAERPKKNEILIGSNVVYAQKIEQMDGTFEQAYNAGVRSMIQRIEKIAKE